MLPQAVRRRDGLSDGEGAPAPARQDRGAGQRGPRSAVGGAQGRRTAAQHVLRLAQGAERARSPRTGSQEQAAAALFPAALVEARRAPRAGRPRRPPVLRQAARPPRTQAPEEGLRHQRLDGGAHPRMRRGAGSDQALRLPLPRPRRGEAQARLRQRPRPPLAARRPRQGARRTRANRPHDRPRRRRRVQGVPRRPPLHPAHVRARVLPRHRLQRLPLLPRTRRLHARPLRAGRRRRRVHDRVRERVRKALRRTRRPAAQPPPTQRLRRTRQRHLPRRVLEPLRRRPHRRSRQRRTRRVPPLLQRRTTSHRHRHDDSERLLRYPLRATRKPKSPICPEPRHGVECGGHCVYIRVLF